MQNLVDINVGLLFAISLLVVSTNTWSHGGRLNSEGCHNDKAASEYHCHTSMSNPKESKSTGYNRDNWSFNSSASPVSNSVLGWYTNINGNATDVDHVVALKDAFMSGGSDWNSSQKRAFANDPFNHVAAVPYLNRTLKNAYVPLKFIKKVRKSRYEFANGKCSEYVDLYIQVKQKYELNFTQNNIELAKTACR
jgi:hypothetical protein